MASPRDVHANMYVMAINIVFFCDHVVDENNVGSSCILLGNIFANNLNLRCNEYKHRAKKDRMDTPVRIPNDIGIDKNCSKACRTEVGTTVFPMR